MFRDDKSVLAWIVSELEARGFKTLAVQRFGAAHLLEKDGRRFEVSVSHYYGDNQDIVDDEFWEELGIGAG